MPKGACIDHLSMQMYRCWDRMCCGAWSQVKGMLAMSPALANDMNGGKGVDDEGLHFPGSM